MQVALHHKLCKPRQLHMNLAEVLRAHLELPHAILPGPINYAKAAGELRAFMTVKQLQAGTTLFSQASPPPAAALASPPAYMWPVQTAVCMHTGRGNIEVIENKAC